MQEPPPTASAMRAIHELQGPQATGSPSQSPVGAEPCTGSRPTRATRTRELPAAADPAAFCTEAAITVVADLSTYWSNSVRPYALMHSPFLRPPVYASVWRVVLTVGGGEQWPSAGGSGAAEVEANVALKAAHDRRMLEVEIQGGCSLGGGARDCLGFSGSAWCIATKAGARFDGVVVPPIPLSAEDTEAAARRWRALKQRPKRLRAVKPNDAEVSVRASPVPLSLTVKAFDADGEEIAKVYNKAGGGAGEPDTGGACGDVGPLVGAAVRAARSIVGSEDGAQGALHVEVEVAPLAPGADVLLCARAERGGGDAEGAAALVTGWLRGAPEPVLRMRLCAGAGR